MTWNRRKKAQEESTQPGTVESIGGEETPSGFSHKLKQFQTK